jgi:hypothetical protein
MGAGEFFGEESFFVHKHGFKFQLKKNEPTRKIKQDDNDSDDSSRKSKHNKANQLTVSE